MTDVHRRPTPKSNPRVRRAQITERSSIRIADIVHEALAEAAKAVPDIEVVRYHIVRAFDLGSEVGSIQLRAIAAERDMARARVEKLEAEIADRDHTIESLRLRSSR